MSGENDRPLEKVLKKIISGLGEKGRPKKEEIENLWQSAAGKKAAGRSRPVSLKKSVLTVNVDNSGWLYELTLEKRGLLEKINRKIKAKKIKDIRFRIGNIKSR